MIEVRNISYTHPGSEHAVLTDVSLAAAPGTLTTILGPNGSGKTTLFKCIAGLWKPQRGDVVFQGQSLRNMSHNRLARIVAMAPQDHDPPFPYTVLDVVVMGRAAHVGVFSTPSKRDYELAEEAISLVGIDQLRQRRYTRISGGERQLVLIARALAQGAPFMLLDEPTSHLDFRNQIMVLTQVRQIVREKMIAALMTIHDPNLANLFSDYVALISNGRVVASGTPEEVITTRAMREVYNIDVSVIETNGYRVIMPRLPQHEAPLHMKEARA
ncbi:MAG: ABC transporter ATP-binding protein [Desulfomonilaceae bacterium]